MSKSTNPAQVNGGQGSNRAQNKDNLDSRKNEEQDFKGSDNTHNKKETKEKHLKEKKQ